MPAFSLSAFLASSADLVNQHPLLLVAIYGTALLLVIKCVAALRLRVFMATQKRHVQAEAKRAAEDRAKARALKVIAANFKRDDRGAA